MVLLCYPYVGNWVITFIMMRLRFGCQATGVFHEVKVFAAAVVKVCLSSDKRLFCASADGVMVMFNVLVPRSMRNITMAWSQEVLISKADLEEYIDKVAELETKVPTFVTTLFRMVLAQLSLFCSHANPENYNISPLPVLIQLALLF